MQQAAATHEPEELRSFITFLHRVATRLEAAQADKNRFTSNQPPSRSLRIATPAPASSTTNQRATPADTAATRNEWVPRGTCAKCLQPGHAYRSCPNPGIGDWQKRCSEIEARAAAYRNTVNEIEQPAAFASGNE